MVFGPGEDADAIAVWIFHNQFAEALDVHLGINQNRACFDEPRVNKVEIDDFDAETPAYAGLSR